MQRFLVVIIITLLSCDKRGSQLFIAGSTTVIPIVTNLIEDFIILDEDVLPPIINAGGSGLGFSYLTQSKIDIGMMSRNITQEEKNSNLDKNFVINTIAYDAVLPVVSSEIYEFGVTALSLLQIRQIYDGSIQNWKELGGPDRSIIVYDKESGRGTRHVFMQAIFGDPKAKAKGADEVVGSNNEEQRAIAQSDSAIGMLSFAWLTNDVKSLNILQKGKILIVNKDSVFNRLYPIMRSLDLVTIGKPRGVSKRFINFLLSDSSQKKIEKLGYVPVKR